MPKPSLLAVGALLAAMPLSAAPLATVRYTVHPDQTKQTILGIGVEIQSDSIGSGNNGLPEAPIAVPHDLTPSERERFAKEMMAGFRYVRLAGGLYWRGLDPEGKFLQPRWPSQLEELREMMDTAGIEGLSFEYWSPAPFWKANRSYTALHKPDGHARNRLRPFAPGFENDPDYQGDRERFLADFAQAVVTDIKTLAAAGLRTSMFGLQNEPYVNHSIYPTCEYPDSASYVPSYQAVASAVRAHDPSIMLFADTYHGFPKLIAPAMSDPAVAALVDAYVVHTIGWPSESVAGVHKEITEKLPPRPWFQNEYEYLTGGATPDRCLNTVEHIMNSFQLGANPTWFWLHALKPIGNAEASGYCLGFWQSQIAPIKDIPSEKKRRWPGGPEFTAIPAQLRDLEIVSAKRGDAARPGLAYNFIVNQPVTVYLAVQDRGGYTPPAEWTPTEFTLAWDGGTDRIFKRDFDRGGVSIPEHPGQADGRHGAPHLCFVAPSAPASADALDIEIGINQPILVRSQAIALERKAAAVPPGHWIYNPYNWHAVGSFAKRMPWNSLPPPRRENDRRRRQPLRHRRPPLRCRHRPRRLRSLAGLPLHPGRGRPRHPRRPHRQLFRRPSPTHPPSPQLGILGTTLIFLTHAQPSPCTHLIPVPFRSS
ncbi:MAG: hypothetical protein MUE42_10500 [Opitutaceae bacterium]|nr:hypothetical protein [Opitutaceae bacterium]